jgi:phosphate transport system substrate-binding protein
MNTSSLSPITGKNDMLWCQEKRHWYDQRTQNHRDAGMNLRLCAALLVSLLPVASGHAEAERDYLIIVGSTTVKPFSDLVVERFAQKFKKPIVQVAGSSGGFMLFCNGVGPLDPDITYSSRPIRRRELATCRANGVDEIVQIKIGYDGIVIAHSKDAVPVGLDRRDIYLALAESVPNPDGTEEFVPNPYKTWDEIDPDLPGWEIEVWGPGSGSGTHYHFRRLAIEQGCRTFQWIADLEGEDPWEYRDRCRTLRSDGAYIEASENDARTVDDLDEDPGALAILSFSVLDENQLSIRGTAVDGIPPTLETIANGSYLMSRSLYLYVKKASAGRPGVEEFLAEFTAERAWGPGGYLTEHGLVPMDDAGRKENAALAHELTPM